MIILEKRTVGCKIRIFSQESSEVDKKVLPESRNL